ncbi:MAG: hypothetical protein HZB29_07365 [Nitrospinae bacterium]|nr:hypothetical protein [Nitrospinota bacterium]
MRTIGDGAVPPQRALETAVENYALYHQCAGRHKALADWYGAIRGRRDGWEWPWE